MNLQEKRYLEIGLKLKEAAESQLFGKSCFKVEGKAFICFFEQCMVFKLTGNVHQEALSLDGATLFDPSGKKRPMKEWVQVPFDHEDKWDSFAKAALNYVDASA
ncbi:MAG: hypothetical protein WC760_07885 [Bacteroidia bacterium]